MASLSRLGAGQKGKIRATVTTLGKGGKLKKGIRVTTNDPVNPVVILRVLANVSAPPKSAAKP